MAATFTDTTISPVVLAAGRPANPFSKVVVNESTLPAAETLTIVLGPQPYYTVTSFGSLSDPLGGGSFDAITHTFTENAVATGTPTSATAILNRLIYTPPTPVSGNYIAVNAAISVSNGVTTLSDPNPVVLETVTPPAISGTISNEPVASGATIRPFASVRVADYNLSYNAQDAVTITLTDGSAAPTDADGLLTGVGLSKTGVGAYTLAATSSYVLQGYLQGLVFAPAAVPAGTIRTTGFALNVTDAATLLASDDKLTSVQVIGPAVMPVPPLIAGTVAGQTVAPGGNAISPFNGVTVSDSNASPQDSATLTVSGGGTLSGAGLVAGSAGTYTVAVTSPAALTAILDKVIFAAPSLTGQASVTSTIKLDVVDGQQIATDSKTTITEVAAVVPTPLPTGKGGNFLIADQTTGQQSYAGGDKYSGPVAGIDQQIILVTPDNLNITANLANVFIHSGSGTDAIDVSHVNGNNTLDGSTGSNFLTGGTGRDTFFLDDRNPTSDVYSTVVNFHSGDNVTIFGVDPVNFQVITQDNQGAVGAKGLTYTFTAAGRPNASVVIAGFSSADLANGRLTPSYGRTPDLPGNPGSLYLNIHGN